MAPSSPASLDTRHSPREILWAFWSVAAAFSCYFCMYGFRKPFTAAEYRDASLWGIGFKTILVTSQVAGYMVSKIIGVRVIAEMPLQRRTLMLLSLIAFAQATLVLFGVVPRPWNAVCLFLNGLPLGLVFGLVVSFLEGRRLTELLTAGLCASFIVADGVTKAVGRSLLNAGIPEDWMPAAAGLIYLVPFAVSVAMLSRIPPATAVDIAARSERVPMNWTARRTFLRRYAGGLIPLIAIFLLVTILRSIRADFAPEIWHGLGRTAAPETYAQSELIVALGVIVVNGAAVLIADNRRAFIAALGVCAIGFVLMAAALIGRARGTGDDFSFMVLIGLGLYLPYVAFHTTIFERLLGMTPERGNFGFLIYLADSVGYLGYVAVMVLRNFGPSAGDVLGLLTTACWLAIGISAVGLLISWRYFSRPALPPSPVPAEAQA